jgi:hypothetical protein
MIMGGAFYRQEKIEDTGTIIYPFFSGGVFWPTAFYVYAFSFFFCVFLRHCPTDHLLSRVVYF